MAVNPAGYVSPMDGGNPRIITAKAIEGILPGHIVSWSGATNAVSSGINSFQDGDLWAHNAGSGLQIGGVAVGSAASGATVGIATAGTVILTCGDTVTAGTTVSAVGAHCIKTVTTAGHVMGRALTNAGSEGYALVSLTNL